MFNKHLGKDLLNNTLHSTSLVRSDVSEASKGGSSHTWRDI